ncbi:MAG: DUF5011 domain-containing protein [bacterium]|nr:DUF5011 domain-containing protein [bacterium]
MNKTVKMIIIMFCILLMISCGVFVYLYNTTKISFKLNGKNEIIIKLDEEYKEEGAVAKINKKDISKDIKINGKVDNKKIGKYEIKYSIKYKYVKDKKELKRIVNVVDEDAPKLELKGKSEISIYINNEYKEEGASAIDNYDGDLTTKVEISGVVDNKKVGTYELTYSVKDSSGNISSIKRKVIVKEKTAPVVKSEKSSTNTSGSGYGLPILMYHYFYDETKGEKGENSNWMEIHAFEKQLKYLKDNNFYFPTWTEVANFVDGKITLPKKSVVISIDDGQSSFFDLSVPLINKMQVPVTSFIITSKAGGTKFKNYQSKYITYQSHTDSMHTGGCTGGHGGLFRCISYKKGLADLNKSISILGTSDVLAYPYGDVTERTLQIMKSSPFKVAVTTKYGKVKKGMDKLQLPRVRMSKGISLSSFAASL